MNLPICPRCNAPWTGISDPIVLHCHPCNLKYIQGSWLELIVNDDFCFYWNFEEQNCEIQHDKNNYTPIYIPWCPYDFTPTEDMINLFLTFS